MSKRIAVVGAGIAGLSCAYELKKCGFKVVVFEKSSFVGGRMSTRKRKGLALDLGANFFVTSYTHTKGFAKELKLKSRVMVPGVHCTFRKGKLCLMQLGSLWKVLRFSSLSFFSRLRLIRLFVVAQKKAAGLDFFDLSDADKNKDLSDAYSYVKSIAGQEVADYIIDGFSSTYQFHRSNEISTMGLFALMGLMAKNPDGFELWHTDNEMQAIPDALAKRLTVFKNCQVFEVSSSKNGVSLHSARGIEVFDAVVIAGTADITKKIYKTPSLEQSALLDKVHYSSTITVSFSVPVGTLENLAVVTVPFVESDLISEFTNEERKDIVYNGRTLVNIGLHEARAKVLMEQSDAEIYDIVGEELMRVCPLIKNAEVLIPHDLQRFPIAMPKYDHKYVCDVIDFWNNGQGDNNVFFCGDFLNAPWVEGSIRCGKKVASRINQALGRLKNKSLKK